MPRFYVDFPLDLGSFSLPEAVVRHINVLRMRKNDLISLFNGNGYDYSARIIELNKRAIEVEVFDTTLINNEADLKIILLVSVIASDKMDLLIQKAVELGVAVIQPMYSHHSQRFSASRLHSRIEHWQKIIISASEQCGRACLASLALPIDYAEAIKIEAEHKFILSPYHGQKLFYSKNNDYSHLVLAVGPEGGLIEGEVGLAVTNGFQPLLLGPRILRAETAAIAGITCLQVMFGDFQFCDKTLS